ncbi:MAG TPA: hypothetical protein DE036_09610 [Actinobacteria bacterium]|nr:hypothetical protein [Actinomycetota bacterium]
MDKRKVMKEEYKQALRPMGVFQVRNLVNGKVMIVRGLNIDGKINSTRFQLEMGSHMNKELQQDWKTYGADSFAFEVLELLEPVEGPAPDYTQDLEVLEELWLEKVQPYGESGYHKMKS